MKDLVETALNCIQEGKRKKGEADILFANADVRKKAVNVLTKAGFKSNKDYRLDPTDDKKLFVPLSKGDDITGAIEDANIGYAYKE